MKTYILLYEDMALFEVVIASYFLKEKGDIIYVSENNNTISSQEGFHINSDISVEQIVCDDVDVFIFPGGCIENIINTELLKNIITELNSKNKIIGGICSGRQLISDELKIDMQDKTAIYNNQIILSPGNEYVDFAIELGKLANIYIDEADLQETIHYFKMFLPV